LPRSYYSLINELPLKPVEDDAELAQAHAILERLFHIEGDAGVDAYVDVLAGLVDAYERTAFPTEAEPWQVLEHLIEARGLTITALAKQAKVTSATLTRVLEQRRPITASTAVKLASFFAVSPEVFLPRIPVA